MSKTMTVRRNFLRATMIVGSANPLGAIHLILKADDRRLSEVDVIARTIAYQHDATNAGANV